MSLLQAAPWTGNIRELRNVVERLVILTPKDQAITVESVQKFASLV
jgi:DNA-binding NtrC family response regulator